METTTNTLLPPIKWSQTKKQIFIVVLVSDAKDIIYEITSSKATNDNRTEDKCNNNDDEKDPSTIIPFFDQFKFKCNQENSKHIYGFEIQFPYAVEKAKIVQKIYGNCVQYTMRKLPDESVSWIWLTKDGSKKTNHFIGIDWDKWNEEDEDESDHSHGDAFSDSDHDDSFSPDKYKDKCGDSHDEHDEQSDIDVENETKESFLQSNQNITAKENEMEL